MTLLLIPFVSMRFDTPSNNAAPLIGIVTIRFSHRIPQWKSVKTFNSHRDVSLMPKDPTHHHIHHHCLFHYPRCSFIIMSSTTTNDIPGNGWSNGDLPSSMFPVTRQGRIELYGANRRWINLHKGWTRIGSGHQHDFRHSTSGVGEAHEHDSPEEEAATVRSLIAQLCESFYQRGWATVSFC